MSKLQNITEAAARHLAGTYALTASGLAADATAGQESGVTTSGVITYVVDGVFKTKAAIDNGQYSAGHGKVLDGYTCLFVFALDASGNLKTYQGQAFKAEGSQFRGYKANKDSNGVVTGYTKETALVDYNCAFAPIVPAGNAVIGSAKIALSGSSGFTAGTTAHNATGVTATFASLLAIPANSNL